MHHSRFDGAGMGLAIKVINNTMHKESGEDLCPWLGCTSPERVTKNQGSGCLRSMLNSRLPQNAQRFLDLFTPARMTPVDRFLHDRSK